MRKIRVFSHESLRSYEAAERPQRDMDAASFLKTRIPPKTKALVQTAAAQAYLTEAAWFRRAVDRELKKSGAVDPDVGVAAFSDGRSKRATVRQKTRIYVRLRFDDRIILQERAAARGMPVATYTSVLLRAHLRQLNPLPRTELGVLKGMLSELGAIGRNLNQIARAANRGQANAIPAHADLDALLKVCEAMRGHVKDLLNANLRSWAVGYVDDQR